MINKTSVLLLIWFYPLKNSDKTEKENIFKQPQGHSGVVVSRFGI